MAEPQLRDLPDPELERALRGLAASIAWPTASSPEAGEPDLAAVVRSRVEALPAPGNVRQAWWRGPSAGRALILALLALLALAALAGAMGLGLPGLRLLLGEAPAGAPASLSPTAGPGGPEPGSLGSSMQLGEPIGALDPAGLAARAGFAVTLPADPAIGAPVSAWIDDLRGGQVTLLWPVGPGRPATSEPGVGLLLSEFEGAVNEGFFSKAIDAGTVVERVRVGGQPGFWISGEPHVLFWDGPGGGVDDARRWVGDVLLWARGPVTFRLESALGRDEAIRIAESLP